MRLASTVNYNGLQQSEYDLFRAYGAEPRKILTGSELTIERIIAGYRAGRMGKRLPPHCLRSKSRIISLRANVSCA